MTHITIKREVLEQAVAALQNEIDLNTTQDISVQSTEDAITALRTALEAKDVEPVAMLRTKGEVRAFPLDAAYELDDGDYYLFTHPAAPDAREEKP
jgi:hypothetical protein